MTKLYYSYTFLILFLNSQAFAETQPIPSTSDIDAIDLKSINRPVLETKQLEINSPRLPYFLFKDRDGTEIREYREPNNPSDIEVHSRFGTSYHLTQPENGALQMHNNNLQRLPTINLLDF